MNAHQRTRAKRLLAAACVASIATMALIALGIILEYQYSKHFFSANYWWYEFRERFLFWEDLRFAFFLNYGVSESTSLLAVVLGTAGLLTWRCVNAKRFARGVGYAMVGTMTMCFAASFFTRQATFTELLNLAAIQIAVVIVFCASCRWSEPLRFSTRDLFALSLLVALYLVVPGLIGKHGNVRSIIFLERSYHGLNVFLPSLGLIAGITVVAFLSNSKLRPEFRAAYLVAVIFGSGLLGATVAWMFETMPTMQSGRGNLAAVNFVAINFRSAYIILFPLSGLIATTIMPILAWILRVGCITAHRRHS